MRARNQHLKRLLSLLLTVAMVLTMIPAAFAADTTTSSGFVIGPYLLAPKTTSMVAVWETSGSEPTTIRFGTDADTLGEAVPVERDPEAPDYGGAQTNIFRYKFSDLTPGTRYYYEVALADGEVSRGTFRILEENPTEIRYISITDTHKFDTKSTFDAAVAAYDPAFIIHGGDMVEGPARRRNSMRSGSTAASLSTITRWFMPAATMISAIILTCTLSIPRPRNMALSSRATFRLTMGTYTLT